MAHKGNTANEAERQYRMEQIISNAFNPGDLAVRLDPSLDISFDTESSNCDPESIDDAHILHEETLTNETHKTFQQDENSKNSATTSDTAEPARLTSIIKTSSTSIAPKPKEHSVRFTDEGNAMIGIFEQQKQQMEKLLEDAREEYQSQLDELKQNQSKVIEVSLSSHGSTSNNSISQHETTRDAEQILSHAQDDMNAIRAYQARLLNKYDNEQIQNDSSHRSSYLDSSNTTAGPSTPIGLPNFTPPTFSDIPTFEVTIGDESLIRMESELQREEDKLVTNQKDLATLRALSEQLERQMHGLTMTSTMCTTRDDSIQIRETSTDHEIISTPFSLPRDRSALDNDKSSIVVKEVISEAESSILVERLNLDGSDVSAPTESTPRTSHVSVVHKKGSVRKISRTSHTFNSADETSYISLPKSNIPNSGRLNFNSSFSSSLSSISKTSEPTSQATLLGITKDRKDESTLLSITKEKRNDSSIASDTVNQIIKETWAEILERENGFPLGVGLSLPSLSVTPISTVNDTPDPHRYSATDTPVSILRPGSQTSEHTSSSRSSKTVSFKDGLSDANGLDVLSESDTEMLTKLLLDKLTNEESIALDDTSFNETKETTSSSKLLSHNLDSTAGSAHSMPQSINVLGSNNIQFDVPQGPVRLSAEDLNQLPDMSSSYEGNLTHNTSSSHFCYFR